jgi:hypothetical protein
VRRQQRFDRLDRVDRILWVQRFVGFERIFGFERQLEQFGKLRKLGLVVDFVLDLGVVLDQREHQRVDQLDLVGLDRLVGFDRIDRIDRGNAGPGAADDPAVRRRGRGLGRPPAGRPSGLSLTKTKEAASPPGARPLHVSNGYSAWRIFSISATG